MKTIIVLWTIIHVTMIHGQRTTRKWDAIRSDSENPVHVVFHTDEAPARDLRISPAEAIYYSNKVFRLSMAGSSSPRVTPPRCPLYTEFQSEFGKRRICEDRIGSAPDARTLLSDLYRR